MKYDEKIAEYMLLAASNLVVSVVSKNPIKMHNVLVDIQDTIDSYIDINKKEKNEKLWKKL